MTPTTCHSVSYLSALSGNAHTSTCPSKAHALAQARALEQEGARNVQVGRFAHGIYTVLDWKRATGSKHVKGV